MLPGRSSVHRFTGCIPFALLAAAVFGHPSAMASPPVVTLSGSAVTVTRLVPGSSLALLAVAKESAYYMARVVSRQELLRDEDRDGQVQYVPPSGVAFRSIWIVVDITTGDLSMAWPDGFSPIEMRQGGKGRGKPVEVIANTLDIGRTSATLLVVRPGIGAWASRLREGTEADADKKSDRRIRVDLSKLRPLSEDMGKAPLALDKGDVVAVLDAATLQYWTSRIE